MKVKDKKVMHFFIAIILDILISVLIPAGNGLTDIGVRAIGAAVATVYLWTFVATDWTSILSVLLFAVAGVMPFGKLLTTGAVPVLLIIVMSAVTIPLSRTGFISRVINWAVTRKFLKGRPWLFFAFYICCNLCYRMFSGCCCLRLDRTSCRQRALPGDRLRG